MLGISKVTINTEEGTVEEGAVRRPGVAMAGWRSRTGVTFTVSFRFHAENVSAD
jgi:hypothetical protein